MALRYMNRSRFTSKKKLTWDLIALAMGSVSDLCIIPAQDYLCLPNSARINTPSTLGGNWKWRMAGGVFDDKLCEKIRKMTKYMADSKDNRRVLIFIRQCLIVFMTKDLPV